MPLHEVTCEICATVFLVKPYRKDLARFCSGKCRSSWVARKYLNKGPKPWAAKNLDGHRHKSGTRFKLGHEPWNKDMKGIHLSPQSEFQKGRESETKMPLGSVVERTRQREGYPRAWVKVAEPNKWELRARLVWAAHNGPIPRGMIVHHKDRNALNDEIDNLQMMTKAEHMNEHRAEILAAKGFDL
jgi:HNH endonuclease